MSDGESTPENLQPSGGAHDDRRLRGGRGLRSHWSDRSERWVDVRRGIARRGRRRQLHHGGRICCRELGRGRNQRLEAIQRKFCARLIDADFGEPTVVFLQPCEPIGSNAEALDRQQGRRRVRRQLLGREDLQVIDPNLATGQPTGTSQLHLELGGLLDFFLQPKSAPSSAQPEIAKNEGEDWQPEKHGEANPEPSPARWSLA